jgi:hypothetical protein
MGYVETCSEHGQYKGDYCGGCVEATQLEVEALRDTLASATDRVSELENEVGQVRVMLDVENTIKESGKRLEEISKTLGLEEENARLREALSWVWNEGVAAGELKDAIRDALWPKESRQVPSSLGGDKTDLSPAEDKEAQQADVKVACKEWRHSHAHLSGIEDYWADQGFMAGASWQRSLAQQECKGPNGSHQADAAGPIVCVHCGARGAEKTELVWEQAQQDPFIPAPKELRDAVKAARDKAAQPVVTEPAKDPSCKGCWYGFGQHRDGCKVAKPETSKECITCGGPHDKWDCPGDAG